MTKMASNFSLQIKLPLGFRSWRLFCVFSVMCTKFQAQLLFTYIPCTFKRVYVLVKAANNPTNKLDRHNRASTLSALGPK